MTLRLHAVANPVSVTDISSAYRANESKIMLSLDDLYQLNPPFKRVLAKELDSSALADRLCPVVFDDSSTGVFVIPEFTHDDQVYALLDLLILKRFKLHPSPIFVVTQVLLVSLIRAGNSSGSPLGPTSRSNNRNLDRPRLLKVFDDIVRWGFERRASDIHFNVRTSQSVSPVYFTMDGQYLSPQEYRHFPTDSMSEMLSVTWMEIQGGNGAVFDPCMEQQGRLIRTICGIKLILRWASLATDQGPSVCLRILRSDSALLTPPLSCLGYLPSQVATFSSQSLVEGGAVVIAGVVGSGKSTTIATLMRDIPCGRKIITLEDPAEYLIPNALQNTVSRPMDGDDMLAFDTKLKTIKRSAMHDLLIGEIRDQPSGRAFCDLAACGTNLYTTLHAGSSLLICERLASSLIGVPIDFLSTPGILKLLVYQRLLPRLCEHCSIGFAEFVSSKDTLNEPNKTSCPALSEYCFRGLADRYGIGLERLRFRNVFGCTVCRHHRHEDVWGLDGRTVVAEMIEPSVEPRFLDLLRDHDNLGLHEWFKSRSRKDWCDPDMTGKTAFACAVYKMSIGVIDPRDIESRFGLFIKNGSLI